MAASLMAIQLVRHLCLRVKKAAAVFWAAFPYIHWVYVMSMRRRQSRKRRSRLTPRVTALAKTRSALKTSRSASAPTSKRRRGIALVAEQEPFGPPEDWYELEEEPSSGYRIVVQDPGPGHFHAVTPDEVRDRLAELPDWMLAPLRVVQLSRITRKKMTFPCYGMQWGCALYLYPIEDELCEYYYEPPKPSVVIESRQFGGKWCEEEPGVWRLDWTEETLRDFYLNNILMHELGHLLDDRNTSYVDRERYAEWFALEYGYKPTRDRRRTRKVRRRHHSA